ncbi:MAG TPA: hypothetical protein VF683_04400 [Chthoniobacterales bacterium]
MESNLITRRLVEAGAILLIGDGLMGFLSPRWHSLVGQLGPQLVKAATEELAAHRTMARVVGAAEVALGLALFSSQRCGD